MFLAANFENQRIILPTEQVAKVTVGESWEVVIAGNITTGYAWKAVSLPAGVVAVGEPKYLNPELKPGERPMPGRGGQFIFTFQAKSAGTGAIKFAYARPWEKDIAPVQLAELKVEVREK